MGLISFVIPVNSQVNELVLKAEQLEALAEKVQHHDFEFIYLDNGSNDASIEVLEDRAEKDKRYRVVILTRDFGSSAQFLAGASYASGDCTIYFGNLPLDASGIFIEMIRHWESGAKVIIGREKDTTPRSLGTLAALGNKITSLFTGIPRRLSLDETNALLIDQQVVYVLAQIVDAHHDVVEILAWAGYQARLIEYSYQESDRREGRYVFQGESITLSPGIKLPNVFRRGLFLGILISAIGVTLTFVYLYFLGDQGEISQEWWLFISSLVIVFGMQIGLFGIFSQKLFLSFGEIHNRPVFIVDHVVNPPVPTTPEGRERLVKMILSLRSIRKQRRDFSASENAPTSDE